MTIDKRVIGLSAAVALLAGGLAGCGGSGSGKESGGEKSAQAVKLTVWSPQEDQKDSSSWLPKMEAAFAKAHPEYKITWKNAVVAEGDAGTTVKQDPSAAADVFMFANDQLGTLVESDAIGELSDTAKAQIKKQDNQEMIDSVTSKGKEYGVPYTGNVWFMYYNKSKFSAEDAKSLDTLLSKGKVSFQLNNSWYLPAFYTGNGSTLFGPNGTDESAGIDFGGAKAADVTKYLVGLKANPNFVLDQDGAGLAGLGNGSVDVLFSGSWDAENVKKALGDNFAVAKLPTYNLNGKQVQMKAMAGSKAVGYNPNTKNPKAASEFAAFLGSTEAQKAHYEMRDIIPTDQELMKDSKISSDAVAVAQNDTLNDTSVLQPTLAGMANFWTPCENFGNAIVNGDVNADNAAAKTEDWNAAYKK